MSIDPTIKIYLVHFDHSKEIDFIDRPMQANDQSKAEDDEEEQPTPKAAKKSSQRKLQLDGKANPDHDQVGHKCRLGCEGLRLRYQKRNPIHGQAGHECKLGDCVYHDYDESKNNSDRGLPRLRFNGLYNTEIPNLRYDITTPQTNVKASARSLRGDDSCAQARAKQKETTTQIDPDLLKEFDAAITQPDRRPWGEKVLSWNAHIKSKEDPTHVRVKTLETTLSMERGTHPMTMQQIEEKNYLVERDIAEKQMAAQKIEEILRTETSKDSDEPERRQRFMRRESMKTFHDTAQEKKNNKTGNILRAMSLKYPILKKTKNPSTVKLKRTNFADYDELKKHHTNMPLNSQSEDRMDIDVQEEEETKEDSQEQEEKREEDEDEKEAQQRQSELQKPRGKIATDQDEHRLRNYMNIMQADPNFNHHNTYIEVLDQAAILEHNVRGKQLDEIAIIYSGLDFERSNEGRKEHQLHARANNAAHKLVMMQKQPTGISHWEAEDTKRKYNKAREQYESQISETRSDGTKRLFTPSTAHTMDFTQDCNGRIMIREFENGNVISKQVEGERCALTEQEKEALIASRLTAGMRHVTTRERTGNTQKTLSHNAQRIEATGNHLVPINRASLPTEHANMELYINATHHGEKPREALPINYPEQHSHSYKLIMAWNPNNSQELPLTTVPLHQVGHGNATRHQNKDLTNEEHYIRNGTMLMDTDVQGQVLWRANQQFVQDAGRTVDIRNEILRPIYNARDEDGVEITDTALTYGSKLTEDVIRSHHLDKELDEGGYNLKRPPTPLRGSGNTMKESTHHDNQEREGRHSYHYPREITRNLIVKEMFTEEGLATMETIRNGSEHYDEGAYLKNYKNMKKPDISVENQPVCWKCQQYPAQCYAQNCGKGSHFVAPETLGEGAKKSTRPFKHNHHEYALAEDSSDNSDPHPDEIQTLNRNPYNQGLTRMDLESQGNTWRDSKTPGTLGNMMSEQYDKGHFWLTRYRLQERAREQNKYTVPRGADSTSYPNTGDGPMRNRYHKSAQFAKWIWIRREQFEFDGTRLVIIRLLPRLMSRPSITRSDGYSLCPR